MLSRKPSKVDRGLEVSIGFRGAGTLIASSARISPWSKYKTRKIGAIRCLQRRLIFVGLDSV
jgi:hypothetical protein